MGQLYLVVVVVFVSEMLNNAVVYGGAVTEMLNCSL